MTSQDLEAVRLVDLAIEEALGLLPAEGARELEALRGGDAAGDALGFEAAVSAVTLARSRPAEPLPRNVRARVLADAGELFALLGGRRPGASRAMLGRLAAAGWAAAASLLVVLLVLDTGPQAPRSVSSARTSQAPVGEGVASVAERERLGERPAVYRAVWSSGGHPAGSGVGGEVVWDPGSNRGHLRFLGLPRNEPRLEQYQLWIFDATRDERFPVDGGVFDATAPEGELIVPIDPRLPVGRASAFVVTLEPPGGVVVSDRSRIVAIARL